MKFSERYGYTTAREKIQIDSVSPELRNSLWSLLDVYVWEKAHGGYDGRFYFSRNPELKSLSQFLWFSHFQKPLDTLPSDWLEVRGMLRTFFFSCLWYEVYDFIEIIATEFPFYYDRDKFVLACNQTLEREVSAYRFVNGRISRITDAVEVTEIDEAVAASKGPVRKHLQRALELLSDKKSPDYRNSIKESISAVESLAGIVVGKHGTLGQLIKKLEDEIHLHPALGTAFSSLYGYTSDEGGIRHAILEEKVLGFEDAKFFLVVCSAFVNFVQSKTPEAERRKSS